MHASYNLCRKHASSTRAGAREREIIGVGCTPYTREGAREREVISAGCIPILGQEQERGK